jgi:hypothetical protein
MECTVGLEWDLSWNAEFENKNAVKGTAKEIQEMREVENYCRKEPRKLRIWLVQSHCSLDDNHISVTLRILSRDHMSEE